MLIGICAAGVCGQKAQTAVPPAKTATPPQTQRPGDGAGQRQQSGKPGTVLTNADVVNMLRTGENEKAILNTFRTRPAKFDVSNQARANFDKQCAAIKPAGLGTGAWATEVKDIWDGMMNVMICEETNGRGGEDACAPPAPTKPGSKSQGPAVSLKPRGEWQ